MDIESIDPELLPALRKVPALDPSKRLVRLLGRYGPRLRHTDPVPGVQVRWLNEDGLRVRLYTPETLTTPVPGLLWIHGGGLVMGTAQQDDKLCAETAGRLGIIVVAVEYRLAPESPFPAALDDATQAWTWTRRSAARLGVDPERIAIGGESAGGGIAASLAQRLRDTSDLQPVAQWLFAPMLDDRTAAHTELDTINHRIWNNSANRYGWDAYLSVAPGSPDLPAYAVPARRTNLEGLPPTWLCSGDIELFHDEIADYATRLRSAGNDVTQVVVPGAPHGFENWASNTKLAESLVVGAQEWLRGRVQAR